MLTIKRTGPTAAELADFTRSIPARIIPYAASTALTRVAQLAQKAIVAEMPRVFDRPTRYTLGATRIVPATVKTLTARVAVKDQVAGGLAPESYLLPEVFGGGRSEKRFERALRYAGVLQQGERIVPGAAAPLDAQGNLSRSLVQRIVSLAGGRAIGRGKAAKAGEYFAGDVRGTRGLWRREGRRLRPVLIFTRKAPQYRKRLDFEAIAEGIAEREFRGEFIKAAEAIANRPRG